MAGALEIRPVRTRRDMNAFIRAAFRAQGHNPRWAPALDMEAHEFFDPKHSPFAKENEIECYVALRDGEPVGRIAAIVNRAHLAYRKDQTGHFGFIEAIDERNVFAALTDEASRFLASRGLTRIMGPFSASINHEVGLLIQGFDETHMVRTNYAPPYYARHLEALGFAKAMDLIAFETKTDATIDEKLERIRSRRRTMEGSRRSEDLWLDLSNLVLLVQAIARALQRCVVRELGGSSHQRRGSGLHRKADAARDQAIMDPHRRMAGRTGRHRGADSQRQ